MTGPGRDDSTEEQARELRDRAQQATARAREAFLGLAETAESVADTYDDLADTRAARATGPNGDEPPGARRVREKARNERRDAEHLRRTAARRPER